MKIFVIVVIYNGMRNNWIEKCFNSVINSSISASIIAIDNNSTDNSVEFIKKSYPNVLLIENNKNYGFGGANNQGLRLALENGGEYFFLLNQDAQLESNTLEALTTFMASNNQYGIISPIHLNGTGDKLDFNFSNYIVPSKCKNLYSDYVLGKVQNRIYESDFICAAGWLLSKECLRRVGGFSPTFFHYGEDDNYIHRLTYKGLKIGVLPNSFIYHDREDRNQSSFFNYDEVENRKILLVSSNPNISKTIHVFKKDFISDIIKNLLFIKPRYVKKSFEKLKFVNSNFSKVDKNYLISISEKEYAYLK